MSLHHIFTWIPKVFTRLTHWKQLTDICPLFPSNTLLPTVHRLSEWPLLQWQLLRPKALDSSLVTHFLHPTSNPLRNLVDCTSKYVQNTLFFTICIAMALLKPPSAYRMVVLSPHISQCNPLLIYSSLKVWQWLHITRRMNPKSLPRPLRSYRTKALHRNYLYPLLPPLSVYSSHQTAKLLIIPQTHKIQSHLWLREWPRSKAAGRECYKVALIEVSK